MNGMRFTPRGYGGHRRTPDQVKREGWKGEAGPWPQCGRVSPPNGLLAVALDDDRLTWPERELVRQLGEKLYGRRPESSEVSR
ncbi:hypothetical protein [Profundibacter sp.]|uniref:hypothetical protein n=1 Tax=Profundibacter sp. TaxID=3101071 RepID=UPI003D0AE30D